MPSEEDIRRESFLRATMDKILAERLVTKGDYERVAGYMRSVWLVAREEDFGEDVILEGDDSWEGSPIG